MQQADDFLLECRDLYEQIAPLDAAGLAQTTAFKGWTIETIVRHLHFWNHMALIALEDGERFKTEIAPVITGMQQGKALPELEGEAIPEGGEQLVTRWWELFERVAQAYSQADPSRRCTWAGPSMSARSCITARQMETWAHGQEIYDLLGRDRVNTDRIRNIVILGINTYGWTFQVRGEDAPSPQPYVELTAPSGECWTFGEAQSDNVIRGSAEAFAQVVTQTRNVVDTDLKVRGVSAERWTRNAQCFFGGPTAPPEPGTRVKRAG